MPRLHVLSAGSALHGLHACADAAAQAAGLALAIATNHGHSIRDAVLRGATRADVVLLPTDMIDALIARDCAREPVDLGRVAIGGAARAGARRPAFTTMSALAAALAAADAVLLTRAPSGDHLMRVIGDLDLLELVSPKLLRFDTSQQLLAALAARPDNALGFSPETEIRATEGAAYLGDLPEEIEVALPYAAARLTGAAQPEAAAALLAFLATPAARAAFAQSGMRI